MFLHNKAVVACKIKHFRNSCILPVTTTYFPIIVQHAKKIRNICATFLFHM